MAIVKPFKAIRPSVERVADVAALPYDVVNSEEAREMTKNNPYSFLHVDKSEIDLDKNIDVYDKKVYLKARENIEKMIADGTFITEDKARLYIYELTMDGKSQTGLVGCTAVDEYLDGTIKKHEFTRADKEKDRINHVDYCNANTGPIFLAYREVPIIRNIINDIKNATTPEYDFVAEDGIGHKVWVIKNGDVAFSLEQIFKLVPYLYIADGHHRTASAAKVALMRRTENPEYTGEEEFNYFLSVLFPADELRIMDYNRLVRDLNGFTTEQFIKKLEEKFTVAESDGQAKPQNARDFGMYIDKKWYMLTIKPENIPNDEVESLDVSILQANVLEDILGIKDIRTDDRIDFVGGIRGLGELVKRVDSGEMKVAFAMYPTSMKELMAIADAGKIMPPKSTWFEPKLRSGLFIHEL